MELKKLILSKAARISVHGLGVIGLPLALLLCRSGFRVVGVDISESRLKEIESRRAALREKGIPELLNEALSSERLQLARSLREAEETQVHVICVPTPVREGEADLSYVKQAIAEVCRHMDRGELVIVESTLPPLASERALIPLVEELTGLVEGEGFYYAYCPERAYPGRLIEELIENSRVIGCRSREAGEIASSLYRAFVKGEIAITSLRVAEVVKLAENAYRDLNIAFANELALICEEVGAPVDEVIRLANMHPRVSILRPGIGVGGPCLPKDPLFLMPSSRHSVIRAGREVNSQMPRHAASLLIKQLTQLGLEPKIAVLGVTYRGDVDVTVESPVKHLVEKLVEAGAEVRVYDPYVSEGFGAQVASSLSEAVKGASCIVIGADHSVFKEMDLKKLREMVGRREPVIFFDGKLAFDRKAVEGSGFIYMAPGVPIEVT